MLVFIILVDVSRTDFPPLSFLSLGLFQPLRDVLPVRHLVDGLHVVRSDVLVLEIVGVLPDVDAEEGDETGRRLQRILAGQLTLRTGRDPDASKCTLPTT